MCFGAGILGVADWSAGAGRVCWLVRTADGEYYFGHGADQQVRDVYGRC